MSNILNEKDFRDDLLHLLYDIKLTCGNICLNQTLKKHPKIYNYLLKSFEKDIEFFEHWIDNNISE